MKIGTACNHGNKDLRLHNHAVEESSLDRGSYIVDLTMSKITSGGAVETTTAMMVEPTIKT